MGPISVALNYKEFLPQQSKLYQMYFDFNVSFIVSKKMAKCHKEKDIPHNIYQQIVFQIRILKNMSKWN